MAAMLSFVTADGDVCKTDGVLKKRAQARLAEIFPAAAAGPEEAAALEHSVEQFCGAAKRLELFKEGNDGFVPDFGGWLSFAGLNAEERGVYLAAASVASRTSMYEIRRNANLLYRCIKFIPEEGLSAALLFRAGYLEQAMEAAAADSSSATSRFNSLIYRTESQQQDEGLLKRLVAAAVTAGVLTREITDKGAMYKKTAFPPEGDEKKPVIKIDALFSITVFPGLPFKELIYLTRFLDIKKFDVVAQFEINKNSALRGFAAGLKPEDITARLEKYSEFPLPQNLAVPIEDWYKIYSSAFLYKGYVLHVSPEQVSKVERLPGISSRIHHTIAPGVYLMNFFSDEEAAGVLDRSGLKQGGEIITVTKSSSGTSFSGVRAEPRFTMPDVSAPPVANGDGGRKIIEGFLEALEKQSAAAPMTKEQYEGLKSRIERKIIIDPSQLKAESVRQEKTEASGMDFLGKLHIIEQAMTMKTMVEIEDQGAKLTGAPVNIEKLAGNAIVTIRLDSTGQDQRYSVGKLQSVKRLRSSIFKEIKWG
jgi:hypothetical protein